MTLFAKNIHYLRKLRNITQDKMQALLTIERSTWSNYENGQTEPKIETLIRISNFFNVDIDAILLTDLQEVRFGQHEERQEISQKGKVSGKVSGKVLGQKAKNYPVHIPSAGQTLYDGLSAAKSGYNQQLNADYLGIINTLKDSIDLIKQANAALLEINRSYRARIDSLEAQIKELQQSRR